MAETLAKPVVHDSVEVFDGRRDDKEWDEDEDAENIRIERLVDLIEDVFDAFNSADQVIKLGAGATLILSLYLQ